MDFLTTDETTFTERSIQVTEQYFSELIFLAILKSLKHTDLYITKYLTGSLLTKTLTGLQLMLIRTVLLILILLA